MEEGARSESDPKGNVSIRCRYSYVRKIKRWLSVYVRILQKLLTYFCKVSSFILVLKKSLYYLILSSLKKEEKGEVNFIINVYYD